MDKKGYFDDIALAWERDHREAGGAESLASLAVLFSLRRNDRVLDAGCGTGRLAPFIRSAIGRSGLLVELDYSGEMLKIGKRTLGSSGPFSIQADVQKIPFKDSRFDRVICFSLFPHIDDKAAALREFRRVLKPGKELIVAHLMGRKELNAFHARLHGPVNHDMIPDESAMKGLFAAAGLKRLVIRDEPLLYLARATA